MKRNIYFGRWRNDFIFDYISNVKMPHLCRYFVDFTAVTIASFLMFHCFSLIEIDKIMLPMCNPFSLLYRMPCKPSYHIYLDYDIYFIYFFVMYKEGVVHGIYSVIVLLKYIFLYLFQFSFSRKVISIMSFHNYNFEFSILANILSNC